MAESAVRFVCALAIAFVPGLGLAQTQPQTDEPPPILSRDVRAEAMVAPSPNEKVEDEVAHRQADSQYARVRLIEGFGCSDPATRTAVAETLPAETRGWFPPPEGPGYRPLAVTWRTPAADYPRALLHAGTPGAVGLLLFIDAEGQVARVEAVCATDPAFVEPAMRVVRENRYRPSSLDGKPIRDLAYQVVAYGVAED
jgi:hypothetical protein